MRMLTSVLVVVLAASLAPAEEAGSISGFVRDASGRALEDVKVTASRDRDSGSPPIARSDRRGFYQMAGLPLGIYTITVEQPGFAAPAPREVRLTAGSAAATADFSLTPLDGAKPPLTFNAAGIRGLIDPGGYSAPAGAAAASGLLSGIAAIKSEDNASAAAYPCSMEQELKKTVDAEPNDSGARLRLGEFYLAHAQFDAARALFAGLAKTRQDARTYRLLAQALEGEGMFAEASGAYGDAVVRDPSEDNLFGVGYELILAGSVEPAAAVFRSASAGQPQSAKLWIGRGVAEFLGGHPDQAVHALLQAIELTPGDARPYGFLDAASTVSQVEGGRVESAFERFVEVAPASAEAWYFRAANLQRMGFGTGISRPEETRRIEDPLRKSIALDPNFAKSHFLLAAVCAEQGRWEEAATEYKKTVELAPDMADAHYRLATAYRQMGQADLAAAEYRTFQEIRQRNKREAAESGLALERFISVFGAAGSRKGAAALCPAGRQ